MNDQVPEVNYKEQVRALTEALQGTMTLSIAYLPTGAMLTAALSNGETVSSLKATKIALTEVLRQVDGQLLQAVAREARISPAPNQSPSSEKE